jgi:glycosyltransferase involved in cell wall biosynthesis
LLAIHHFCDPNAGAPRVTLKLAEYYRRYRHSVTLCFLDTLGANHSELVTRLLFPFRLARYCRGLLERGEIDVIDAATGDGWVLGMLWRPQWPALLVARSHGSEHRYYAEVASEMRAAEKPASWKFHALQRLALALGAASMRRAGLVLQLNREDLEFTVTRLGVSPACARLVANGIDDCFHGLPMAPSPAADDGVLRIAWIGAWAPRKGTRFAVESLCALLGRFARLEASFLGTECDPGIVLADFPSELRQRIRVVSHYENSDLPRMLADHHLQLVTSVAEGFGIALLEGMACGLAPVAAATQGPAEIVSDGRDGLLVAPRDAAAAEAAIARLVEDRALLDSLRRNAHAKAQRFGWDAVARMNLALYDEFLGARDAKRAYPDRQLSGSRG